MEEKKYESVSDTLFRLRNQKEFSYDTNEQLDNQFINKDELRDKIKQMRMDMISKINYADGNKYSKDSIKQVGTCEIVCTRILGLLL